MINIKNNTNNCKIMNINFNFNKNNLIINISKKLKNNSSKIINNNKSFNN